MTADTHPIHLHLVQFQLLNRQKFNLKRYEKAFGQANPVIPADTYVPVPVAPYLQGKPTPADANERGWKDTYRANPGEVIRFLVRFAPQDESPAFAFDATAAPGYVWHCHILEHEENDMMHRYELVAPVPASEAATAMAAAALDPAPRGSLLLAQAPIPMADQGLLRFSLPAAGRIELDVYAVTGQRVRSLASGWFEAGEHTVPWRRVDDAGQTLRGGVYFVHLRGEGFSRTQKLVVAP